MSLALSATVQKPPDLLRIPIESPHFWAVQEGKNCYLVTLPRASDGKPDLAVEKSDSVAWQAQPFWDKPKRFPEWLS